MMLITGMLIFGNMSVGVRTIASGPRIRSSMASTTNVYGLRRASRTIHMIHSTASARSEASRKVTAKTKHLAFHSGVCGRLSKYHPPREVLIGKEGRKSRTYWARSHQPLESAGGHESGIRQHQVSKRLRNSEKFHPSRIAW